MQGRHPFDLSDAAPGQFGGARDAHAGIAKADDATVVRKVGLTPGIARCPLGNLDPLALVLSRMW